MSRLNRLIRNAALGVAVAAFCGSAYAATQGAVGGNSTGSLDITVTVNDEVRISNLVDINGVFDGTNDIVGSSPACVYRNGTGLYQITASGSGAAGAFTITDGVFPTPIPYTVTYDDGSGASAMATGVTLAGQTGADPASDTCAGTGDNGTVGVTIAATDIVAAPAGSYTGTLTLVVAPE